VEGLPFRWGVPAPGRGRIRLRVCRVPVALEQFLDAAGRMRADPRQDVTQAGERIDPAELATGHHAAEDRRPAAAVVVARRTASSCGRSGRIAGLSVEELAAGVGPAARLPRAAPGEDRIVAFVGIALDPTSATLLPAGRARRDGPLSLPSAESPQRRSMVPTVLRLGQTRQSQLPKVLLPEPAPLGPCSRRSVCGYRSTPFHRTATLSRSGNNRTDVLRPTVTESAKSG